MTEPDVALTDFAVALEGMLFFASIRRSPDSRGGLRFWLAVFFASVSAASLFGGMFHGFFLDEATRRSTLLWVATLLAMGVTALSLWAIGAKLLFAPRTTRWALIVASAQFAIYAVVVLFWAQNFWLGIADNLPSILFLLLALGLCLRREQNWNFLLAAAGPALVLIAAVLQQFQVGIHPIYFSYNAVYHCLQAIALWLFFLGSRGLIAAGERNTAGGRKARLQARLET